jgi:hypothetical protein
MASSPESRILFTAVPDGITNKSSLVIAVLVTPKLRGTIGDVFRNWTTWVASHNSFQITIANTVDHKSTTAACTNALVPELWTSLFSNIPFEDCVPPVQPSLKTYNSKQVSDCVHDVYAKLGAHFANQTPAELAGAYSQFHSKNAKTFEDITNDHAVFAHGGNGGTAPTGAYTRDRLRLSGIASQDASQPPITEKAQQALEGQHTAHPLVDLLTFIGRVQRKVETVDHNLSTAPPISFHQCISLLMHHPSLCRALGLILDFEISNPGISDGPVDLSVAPSLTIPAYDTISARTKASISAAAEVFEPRNQDPASHPPFIIKEGHIVLDSEIFQLETAAIESGGSHVAAYANDQNKILNQPQNDAAAQVHVPLPTPPALTTTGIALYHRNRAAVVSQRTAAAVSQDGASTPELFAQDLLHGFAVDICIPTENEGSSWYHITQRRERFKYRTVDIGGEVWEAPVRTAGIISSDKAPTDSSGSADLSVSDMLFNWRGPSLGVRPSNEKAQPDPSSTKKVAGPWEGFLKAEIEPVDGVKANDLAWSLVHVGNNYQVVLRAVYVTGKRAKYNGKSAFNENIAVQYVSKKKTLRRYEPVASPRLLFPPELESLGQEKTSVVILRSTVDPNTLKLKYDRPSSVVRYLVPPAVSLDLARAHMSATDSKKLDTGFEGLGFDDRGDLKIVVSPPDPRHSPPQPYLPDPLCVTAILHLTTVNGKALGTQTMEFYPKPDSWPACHLNQIEVRASRSDAPTMEKPDKHTNQVAGITDESQRTVINVPPGWTVLLHISTALDADSRRLMALLPLILKTPELNPDTNTPDLIEQGLHPMFTPARVLRIFHAVDRPLTRPGMMLLNPAVSLNKETLPTTREMERVTYLPATATPIPPKLIRQVGSTDIDLDVKFTDYDPNSTGTLSLIPNWTEWVDDPKLSGSVVSECSAAKKPGSPVLRARSSPPFEITIPLKTTEPSTQGSTSFTHKLPDTKYRRVRYDVVSKSRYTDMFPPSKVPDSSEMLGSRYSFDVLASKEPDPPKLLYVLPSFGWKTIKSKTKKSYQHIRSTGLRVFLGRPWFSSGDDELLGVIVKSSDKNRSKMAKFEPIPLPNKQFDDVLANAVTRWGGDPTREARNDERQDPNVSEWSFPEPKPCATGAESDESIRLQPAVLGACGWDLQPPELRQSSQTVDVIGYRPEFDEERSLWYCDIGFDSPPLYGTFLRLALARYQPHAVKGRELSTIVLADFSFLNSDRVVHVAPNGWRSFAVELHGIAATPAKMNTEANCYEVTIEKEIRGAGDSSWFKISDVVSDPKDPAYRDDSTLLWRGTIPRACVCSGQRLVIREYEQLARSSRRPVYLDVLHFD